MDPESAEALVEAFVAFDRDAEAKASVLWGEGRAFCAGFDLNHAAAEAMAQEIARYPQACMRAGRRPLHMQQGLPLPEAMRFEWMNGVLAFFTAGKGRHGGFDDL